MLFTRAMEGGYFPSRASGLIGRRTSSPPQFGQTPFRALSVQFLQNVHSKEQMQASIESGGRSRSQRSQFGLSSRGIAYRLWQKSFSFDVRKRLESGRRLGHHRVVDLDQDVCYRALRSRDARFGGRFFVAVRTTGIYCRPICPARPVKRENAIFFASAAAARGRPSPRRSCPRPPAQAPGA